MSHIVGRNLQGHLSYQSTNNSNNQSVRPTCRAHSRDDMSVISYRSVTNNRFVDVERKIMQRIVLTIRATIAEDTYIFIHIY